LEPQGPDLDGGANRPTGGVVVTRSYQTLTDARKDVNAAGKPPQGLTREQACLWYWQNTNLSLPVISATVGWNDKSIRDLVKAANATRPTKVITVKPKAERPGPERDFASQAESTRDRVSINRRLREQFRQDVLRLWDDGLDIEVIALRVVRSPTQVRLALKREGVDLKAPRRTPVAGSPTGLNLSSRASHKGQAAYWWRRT